MELSSLSLLQHLDDLLDDFIVMEMIVYDCNYGDKLSFKQLQEMNNLERLNTIMSKVNLCKHA